MKIYPDVRAAKPAMRAFPLVNFIPALCILSGEIHIGFWRSAREHEWNPVMAGYIIRYSRTTNKISVLRRLV